MPRARSRSRKRGSRPASETTTWAAASGARGNMAARPNLVWSATITTWREAGARLVGGCCRTGPSHVHALRAALG